MRFEVKGETPSKKNSRVFLKNGRNIPSKRYLEWHSLALGELFNQLVATSLERFPLDEEVEITLCFYHGDLRRRDSDNGTSSILDTLVDAHILKDDNWQVVKTIVVHNEYDKGNPRCIIDIEPIRKGL